MAETKAVATYESIMRDIKARKFSPIYILMGDESYFIDKICAAIMESVLPEEEREFNQFVVEARYNLGLTYAVPRTKFSTFQFTLGYRFDVVKGN